MPVSEEKIQLVRRFNRFYTRPHRPAARRAARYAFTLTQARVLFEIAHRAGNAIRRPGRTARRLDPAYLSRLLASFERRKLAVRTQSRDDRRVKHLRLTAKGRTAFARLDALSAHSRESHLLGELPPAGQSRLTESMTAIRTAARPCGEVRVCSHPAPASHRRYRLGDCEARRTVRAGVRLGR